MKISVIQLSKISEQSIQNIELGQQYITQSTIYRPRSSEQHFSSSRTIFEYFASGYINVFQLYRFFTPIVMRSVYLILSAALKTKMNLHQIRHLIPRCGPQQFGEQHTAHFYEIENSSLRYWVHQLFQSRTGGWELQGQFCFSLRGGLDLNMNICCMYLIQMCLDKYHQTVQITI
ncbi:Hypothetical_protein [Hexamita inflata]|uniref:Hypothetical_protein n=1 Tax=Hexamita inflata TaxID=28002 RepID=A0ABP1IAP4_9EUKA